MLTTAGKSSARQITSMNSDVKTIRNREVNKKQSNYIKKIQMQLIDVQQMLHNIDTDDTRQLININNSHTESETNSMDIPYIIQKELQTRYKNVTADENFSQVQEYLLNEAISNSGSTPKQLINSIKSSRADNNKLLL